MSSKVIFSKSLYFYVNALKVKKNDRIFELLKSQKSEILINLSKQIIRNQTIDMDTDDELETTSFQVKVILRKNKKHVSNMIFI